jgi:hypothetical protein
MPTAGGWFTGASGPRPQPRRPVGRCGDAVALPSQQDGAVLAEVWRVVHHEEFGRGNGFGPAADSLFSRPHAIPYYVQAVSVATLPGG